MKERREKEMCGVCVCVCVCEERGEGAERGGVRERGGG